jgi:predicted nucleic acid-binding protein
MPAADAFFDANILIYFVSFEERKALRSAELLARGGIVSVQVLNEFVNVARRKQNMSWPGVRASLEAIRSACTIVPLTLETHERGIALAQRHNFSVYDAMIIAAAQLAGCRTLYTEDLQNGRVVDGVKIVDPYG